MWSVNPLENRIKNALNIQHVWKHRKRLVGHKTYVARMLNSSNHISCVWFFLFCFGLGFFYWYLYIHGLLLLVICLVQLYCYLTYTFPSKKVAIGQLKMFLYSLLVKTICLCQITLWRDIWSKCRHWKTGCCREWLFIHKYSIKKKSSDDHAKKKNTAKSGKNAEDKLIKQSAHRL